MDFVAATPTTPRDYVALTASYAILAGAVGVLATRNRDDPAPVEATEFALYGVATAGLTLLSKEKVTSWIRSPFVDEPAAGERRPRGRGGRYAIGELLTWGSSGLGPSRRVLPVSAPPCWR